MGWSVVVIIGILIIALIVSASISEKRKIAAMSPEEQANYKERKARRSREASAQFVHGPVNPQIICPHCQWKGTIRTKPIKKKAGISGGKATAAILTGGVSMLATGLSRKEALTQAHCDNCKSTWSF
jgi:hypothetical protein